MYRDNIRYPHRSLHRGNITVDAPALGPNFTPGLDAEVVAGAPQATDAILTVGPACTYANLQAAVDAAAPYDTIHVHGTTWTGSIALASITKSLYIFGGLDSTCTSYAGTQTALDAGAAYGSIIEISGAGTAVDLYYLRLTGGTDAAAGALEILGGYDVRLFDVDIIGNSAEYGGGFYLNNAAAYFNPTGDVRVLDNVARVRGGGVYQSGGNGYVDDYGTLRPLFAGNVATTGDGGGFYLTGVTTAANYFNGVEIQRNRAPVGRGGGIFTNGVTINGACNIAQDGNLPGINADPLFVTTARGSHRLNAGSPAVDACNSGTTIGDLDNVARPKDGDATVSAAEYDMGAFEFVCTSGLPATTVGIAVAGGGSDVHLSWTPGATNDFFTVYRETAPYFTAGAGTWVYDGLKDSTGWTDPGAAGDPLANRYYYVYTTNCDGGQPQQVEHLGKFDFSLVPGS